MRQLAVAARRHHETVLLGCIEASVTAEVRGEWLSLLLQPVNPEAGVSRLDWLRAGPVSKKPPRAGRSSCEDLVSEVKLLETANIKLASVAADAFGVSGLAMLQALVENSASPEAMANLAKGRLRRKIQPLALALAGP